MNSLYRLYLRSSGRIVCRHDIWAFNEEEAGQIAAILAGACSDRCDEFEIWRGRQALQLGRKPNGAAMNGSLPAHILAAASEAAEWLQQDGWRAFDGKALPSLRALAGDLARRRERLAQIVGDALSLTGADMGNIQILDKEAHGLRIAAHQGFQADFLNFFALVQHGEAACGSALKCLKRVIVTDVAKSPIFNGKPSQEVMLDSGARSVQSTPLVHGDRLVGMLSTHRRSLWRLDARELDHLDRIAALAVAEIAGSPTEP